MKKVKKPKKSIHKLFAILISAFAVNFLTIGLMQTYSCFFDSKTSSVSANVLNAEDIIEVVIGYDSDLDGTNEYYTIIPKQQETISLITNPKEIRVTRKDQTLSPNIYFDIKDSLANYVLQVHPVDFLDNNNNPLAGNTETVKIIPICNQYQVSHFSGSTFVQGRLSIRYLNGFISDTINIRINKDVLLGEGRYSYRDNQ
jgi:hypothetical protein